MTHRNDDAAELNRRELLGCSAAALAGLAWGATGPWGRMATAADRAEEPLRVAVVMTEFTYRSHAHVILENFLEPYLFNGQRIDPNFKLASFYVDQFPETEMAREVSRQYAIPIFETIDAAIKCGGDRVAVDAVLSIGEHGKYPYNEKGQHMYPRKRFFDGVVEAFRSGGAVAPVFTDKHLSYRWDWAREMYDTSRSMGFPLMAGSSVPLAQRWPVLELPSPAKITSAVSIHGGGVESYDFHALEVLQSMIEDRPGGESGIEKVQFLTGDALWKAADAELWSISLAEAAMETELGPGQPPLRELMASPQVKPAEPHGILLHYRDGLTAIALKVGSSVTRWNFACQLEGETQPRATRFYVGPWLNRNLFRALSHAIQTFFQQGQAPYPVERTLLVTGLLDRAMDSRQQDGAMVETPELDIAYTARDFSAMREMGATWKIIHEGVPQPDGIVPGGTL